MSILKDMDELLKNDVVDRHSFFQLRHFLIDSEPTTQGRMWQALRELKTRREALTGITTEIEEQKDARRYFSTAPYLDRSWSDYSVIDTWQRAAEG